MRLAKLLAASTVKTEYVATLCWIASFMGLRLAGVQRFLTAENIKAIGSMKSGVGAILKL